MPKREFLGSGRDLLVTLLGLLHAAASRMAVRTRMPLITWSGSLACCLTFGKRREPCRHTDTDVAAGAFIPGGPCCPSCWLA